MAAIHLIIMQYYACFGIELLFDNISSEKCAFYSFYVIYFVQ